MVLSEETMGSNYKENRLQQQIEWHSQRARQNKLMYRIYQIIIIVTSAIISLINIADFANFQTRIFSSVLGGIIVVVTGITQLEKHEENWLLYRTTEELLKREKDSYEYNTGNYANLEESQKNKLLVERVESIVSSETSKYFSVHQPQRQMQRSIVQQISAEEVPKRLSLQSQEETSDQNKK